MKAKATFPIIGFIALLIVGLCIPTTSFAQQKSNETSITKDISLTHIDGGATLTLDLSKHIGLTTNEIKKLANSLSIGMIDNVADPAKGVTIELLKPADSTLHSKALVIRDITTKSAGRLVGATETTDVEVKVEFVDLPKAIDGAELRKEFLKEVDKNRVVVRDVVRASRDTIWINLYNTTKSRINLKNWQIRLTYGSIPDETDTETTRVIDRMSNVGDKVKDQLSSKLHNPPAGFVFPGNSRMSRQIDFELLNDPTKTQDEQLSAISDGTLKTSWKKSWLHKTIIRTSAGIDPPDRNNDVIYVVPRVDKPKVKTRVTFVPRKPVNENLPPTDDR
ncbi:MAG: hypothetical protein OXM61_24075 [Candidatus Poribacteria bacterium]|nr:hypothetical protein [Candidatus Poribacteria bacterium]